MESTGNATPTEDAVRRRLAQMRVLLDKAEATLAATPIDRQGDAAAIRADYLAKLQRLSGWALRDAVGDGLLHGMTWRWMGTVCQLPVGTLHRQFKAGGRIVVRDNVTQTIDHADPQDEPIR